jgi:hypothetical protein
MLMAQFFFSRVDVSCFCLRHIGQYIMILRLARKYSFLGALFSGTKLVRSMFTCSWYVRRTPVPCFL